ncbi:MAG: hypothetical protein HZB76_06130 [Chlamydiae bacterium]|nr:hypothetical protein [Chlamydiota bacterium]
MAIKLSAEAQLFGKVYESLMDNSSSDSENLEDSKHEIVSKIHNALTIIFPNLDQESLIADLATKITKNLVSDHKNILQIGKKIQILVIPQQLSFDDIPGVFINENNLAFPEHFPIPGESYNLLKSEFASESSSTKRRRTQR